MKKKIIIFAVILACSLVSWIYWSSNIELNNTITFLTLKSNFVESPTLTPNFTCKDHPFLLILVTSYIGHVELRSAHRKAMSQEFLQSMNVRRVFLLAQIPDREKYITQRAIEDENNIYGDILQGSFIENYRNLTFKHLMGLQWASTICHNATYILKVDDDTVFNLERTYKLLQKERLKDSMLGYMLNNTIPKRKKQNKWYVTWEEYPRNDYPPYLSGWYYLTTPKVAARLCNEAMYHPKFWIDDILITGLLTEALNIKLKQLPENYWLEYYELLECCMNDMIKNHIYCEYVVGPNGGRNSLIYEYNEAIRNCDMKNCTNRVKPLKKSCIAYGERNIFSDGKAEVYHVKL